MEKTLNDLPVFKMVLGETGFEALAHVDDPAIQELWVAMSKHEPKEYEIKLVSEEKRIIMSPMLIANQMIYREKDGKKFYVYFPPETIEAMVQKLMKEKLTDSVNEMHVGAKKIEDVYIYQIYLVNRTLGINPPTAYEDIPDGSAIIFEKFDNDQAWADVKAKKYKGVSIEGSFKPVLMELTDQDIKKVANIL